MRRLSIAFALVALVLGTAHGQEVWDLRKCVEYALANNVSIRQRQTQERLNELTWQQSRDARWPSLNAQTSLGEQFGRSIDPTSNQFTSNNITFNNISLQSGVTLFNWFSQRNLIDANRLTFEASQAQTTKLKDDIALNVAAAYLQALLAKEQMRIATIQVNLTTEQLRATRIRVEEGALPELNAAELEAQLARDTAAIVNAQSTYRINLLTLKSWLNLDAAYPLEVEAPDIERIPVMPLAELNPAEVYQQAVTIRPQQVANKLLFDAAGKNVEVARASMYPTISAFGNLQSAYSSALSALPSGANITTIVPTPAFITLNGTNYFLNSPVTRPEGSVKANYFRQLDFNFRQAVGVSLQVPIFNGHQARTAWKRAQVQQDNISLQMRADSLVLKQDIYTAYQNAANALAVWTSRRKALETVSYSYNLARLRYNEGLLNIFELINLQTNMQRAEIDVLTARYDYVFRTKILEFYRGGAIGL